MICVGITLTIHFCGGMLASVSAAPTVEVCESVPDSCCIKAGKFDEDCCNDSVIDLSEVSDDSLIDSSDISKQFVAIIPDVVDISFKTTRFNNKITLPNYTFQSNAPPLYKLYGSYIYYA